MKRTTPHESHGTRGPASPRDSGLVSRGFAEPSPRTSGTDASDSRADTQAPPAHGLEGLSLGSGEATAIQRLAHFKYPEYRAVGISRVPAKTKKINIGLGDANVGLFELSVGRKADRKAALVAMGAKAGEIGAVRDGLGVHWVTNPYYLDTTSPRYLGQNRGYVDPFVVRLQAEYGETRKKLALDFQMANRWTGYVIRVEDDGVAANMVNDERHWKNIVDEDTTVDDYSNVHMKDVETPLEGILGNRGDKTKTMRQQEASFDAFTKLAGEGARFQAVRRHAGRIQDNSYFATVDETNESKYWGLEFKKLWQWWEEAFGKKFNITDKQLRDAINNEVLPSWPLDESDLGGKDYNLDTSAAFEG